ncbi:MAG TPA: peptidoglycan editing factor PgeF [Gammaproteobacteria bacterium]|nr:peptidoglycan editing factor PgeF [Gammaproteobacteria bacterium]
MRIVEGVASPHVRVLTTTRDSGVSQGPYRSLNLAGHVGDDPAAVAENRRRLVDALALPGEPAWLEQVHGTRVLELAGDAPSEAADAAFARKPGVVLAILTADCLPVVLSEQDGAAVAVVHAGWRGMASGIIETAVEALAVAPKRLQAWLGPAIGPVAYEVGADVRDAFVDRDAGAAAAFTPGRPDKWQCDLFALARRRLMAAGIGAISGGEFCTHTDADRFFSYRRDGQCGRMATLAWIEQKN